MPFDPFAKAKEYLQVATRQDSATKVDVSTRGEKTIFSLEYGEEGFACVDVSALAADANSEGWVWIKKVQTQES